MKVEGRLLEKRKRIRKSEGKGEVDNEDIDMTKIRYTNKHAKVNSIVPCNSYALIKIPKTLYRCS